MPAGYARQLVARAITTTTGLHINATQNRVDVDAPKMYLIVDCVQSVWVTTLRLVFTDLFVTIIYTPNGLAASAIAFNSETLQYGFARNYQTVAEAERAALANAKGGLGEIDVYVFFNYHKKSTMFVIPPNVIEETPSAVRIFNKSLHF